MGLVVAGAAVIAGLSLGCGGARVVMPLAVNNPVTVVPTTTEGVAFVIINPAVRDGGHIPGQRGTVAQTSQYTLVCDARAAAAMQCRLIEEIGSTAYTGGGASTVPAAPPPFATVPPPMAPAPTTPPPATPPPPMTSPSGVTIISGPQPAPTTVRP
jgi:hypothetical protein